MLPVLQLLVYFFLFCLFLDACCFVELESEPSNITAQVLWTLLLPGNNSNVSVCYLLTASFCYQYQHILSLCMCTSPAPPVKNWRILSVQSFTAHVPLLKATSAFGLGRRC